MKSIEDMEGYNYDISESLPLNVVIRSKHSKINVPFESILHLAADYIRKKKTDKYKKSIDELSDEQILGMKKE